MSAPSPLLGKPDSLGLAPLISAIQTALQQRGFFYPLTMVQRYAASLLSHRFVVLAGPSGTGKTRLAEGFANAICEKPNEQILVQAVGADWQNRVPLLGYPDPLQPHRYESTPTIDFLIRATETANQSKPFFLILDEMNLSHVERYFADFLSAMERGGEIVLYSGPARQEAPRKITMPKNVFIIGTVNFDHTTHPLSPKVLDRVQIVELTTTWDNLRQALTLRTNSESNLVPVTQRSTGLVYATINEPELPEVWHGGIEKYLSELFAILDENGYSLGYRVMFEIRRFCGFFREIASSSTIEEAFDIQVLQKILPRIEGGRTRTEAVLTRLATWCEQSQFVLSGKKVARMQEKLRDGYATPWE